MAEVALLTCPDCGGHLIEGREADHARSRLHNSAFRTAFLPPTDFRERWWREGTQVNSGESGDERFVADAATEDDAERFVRAHNGDHKHGDQDCDPSEEAAIAQMLRDEGPMPHYMVGLDCWCHPYRDPAEPEVVIHREDARV